MKRETWLPAAGAAVLSFAAGVSSVGCFLTAFELTLADPIRWLLMTGLCALVSAAALCFRRGGWALAAAGVLACGWLWWKGTLKTQSLRLFYRIFHIYDRAYGLGLMRGSSELWNGLEPDLPLTVLGAFVAVLVCLCLCRRTRLWPAVFACLLPLLPCIVVTDTVPGEGYLFLWLAVLILLILPAAVRRESPLQGLILTAAAVLPTALFLLLLFRAVPQEGYVNQAEELRTYLFQSVRSVPEKLETTAQQLTAGLRSGRRDQVDLRNAGPRPPFSYPVMEVTAESGGLLYLRGQDYDVYDGLGWTASQNRRESFALSGGAEETLRIRTQGELTLQYLPYYTDAVLVNGLAENPEALREYAYTRTRLPEDWRIAVYSPGAAAETPDGFDRYLSLPESTRDRARAFLDTLHLSGSHTARADAIAALVTDSAVYDRNTAVMPREEEDFALWFLEESETGYCIHFATAATVLLRAADIPARYVTGYLTEVRPGSESAVTEADAHAWAEYYEPLLDCWLPLEATPGESMPQVALPDRADPPQTEPVPTETDPTVPTELPPETLPETTGPGETASTEGSAPAAEPTEPPATPPPEKGSLPLLLLIPLAAVTAVTQRLLRLELRRSRRRKGSTNQRALACYGELLLLSRLGKDSIPENLVFLAEKAKFSNHRLQPEELGLFEAQLRSCHRQLKQRSFFHQLLYRYVYAIY